MSRDLYHSIREYAAVVPAAHAAPFDSLTVDLQMYDSCLLVVQSGAYTSGSFAVAIEESDDDVTYAAAPADVVLPLPVDADGVTDPIDGTVSTLTLDGASQLKALGYLPHTKRYIHLAFTGDGSMVVSAVAILGHKSHLPPR